MLFILISCINANAVLFLLCTTIAKWNCLFGKTKEYFIWVIIIIIIILVFHSSGYNLSSLSSQQFIFSSLKWREKSTCHWLHKSFSDSYICGKTNTTKCRKGSTFEQPDAEIFTKLFINGDCRKKLFLCLTAMKISSYWIETIDIHTSIDRARTQKEKSVGSFRS